MNLQTLIIISGILPCFYWVLAKNTGKGRGYWVGALIKVDALIYLFCATIYILKLYNII
jgi:hypothetical protein